jgi:hypothetical protein
MSNSIGLSEANFLIFAARHYDNIFYDTLEFQEDLKRFAYLKRLFNQYHKTKEIKERLALNHLIVIFNMWPTGAVPMLFVKLQGYESIVKTFLSYMDRMPTEISNIGLDKRTIRSSDIEIDEFVMELLQKND